MSKAAVEHFRRVNKCSGVMGYDLLKDKTLISVVTLFREHLIPLKIKKIKKSVAIALNVTLFSAAGTQG